LGYVLKHRIVKGPQGFYLRRKRLIPFDEVARYICYQVGAKLFLPSKEAIVRTEAMMMALAEATAKPSQRQTTPNLAS
jgi:hypothetical protein